METMKTYIAVEFEDLTHSVVPITWVRLEKDQLFVHWPKEDVETKAKNAVPPHKKWKLCKAKIIAQSCKYLYM
jgi:hypothetical protein